MFSASDRLEPWRDWVVIALINQGLLLTLVVVRPGGAWWLLAAVPLAIGLSMASLTVLHDAGHRRFARRAWPNLFAVHTAAPFGLWVGHWTLKHRVHHRVPQVYPLDENTRSSAMLRMHPANQWHPIHRWQHIYAWGVYGLAWAGEVRSQVTYLRTGVVLGADAPPTAERVRSFVSEKALCFLVLSPYVWLLGIGELAALMVVAMTLGSVLTAIVLVIGHINMGLEPTASTAEGRDWTRNLVLTTASFSTGSPVVRWLTGGMTHHVAHHLKPTAPRAALPALHRTTVPEVAARCGLPLVEYPTVSAAIKGHYQRLRDLGQPESATISVNEHAGERAALIA
jgi:linoleoyl-CoA desaturase